MVVRTSVVLCLLLVMGAGAVGCAATTAALPGPPIPIPAHRPVAPAKPYHPDSPAEPQKRPVAVPYSASGRYAVVPGRAAPRAGHGTVVRYLVEVERGLPFDGREFAARVHRTLNDPRGWARFQRVDHPRYG